MSKIKNKIKSIKPWVSSVGSWGEVITIFDFRDSGSGGNDCDCDCDFDFDWLWFDVRNKHSKIETIVSTFYFFIFCIFLFIFDKNFLKNKKWKSIISNLHWSNLQLKENLQFQLLIYKQGWYKVQIELVSSLS